MGRQEEIIKERKKKIEELRKLGINPYPYSFDKKNDSKEMHEKYAKLKPDTETKDKVAIAGRVIMIRDIGQIIFSNIRDSAGDIQIVMKNPETSEEVIKLFKKYVDTGDFVGVEGNVIKTKRGELSVLVKKLEILSKSVLPLPEKFHGLVDKEERYRKRYLDLIMNPEVREVFVKRAQIIEEIRTFMREKNVQEVETPLLQPLYGGGAAEPFITKLNVLDMKVYMSISPELYLKRLVSGGMERVYTICKNFRNEGVDKSHNPEFTMIEWYISYKDYNDMMEFTEELLERLAKKITGNTKIKYQDNEIDFKRPFKKITMKDAIKKYGKIDVDSLSDKELIEKAKELDIEESFRGGIINALFEKLVEQHLIQPTFVTDYPKEICPLTKGHRKDSKLVERFELFVNGFELANAYSELNDPEEQEEKLREQLKDKARNKAHIMLSEIDEDFLESMKIGLPPLGGVGLGIDRLVILLTNSASIRDVILFPFMKPEKDKKEKEEKKK